METISGVCRIIGIDSLTLLAAYDRITAVFAFLPLDRIFIMDYRKAVIQAACDFIYHDGDPLAVKEAVSQPASYSIQDGYDGKIDIIFNELPVGTNPESIDQVFLFKKTGTEIPANVLFYESIVISPNDIAMAVLYTGKTVQN